MAKDNKLIKAANFRDFDWNKAKLFYHIAKCGSFMKAGRLAGTDQAALTRQIQALEKQIGAPLLVRKPGGVTLTRKGEELLDKVAPFFLEMRGFNGNSYVDFGEEKKRKIRIISTHTLTSYVLSDLLMDYQAKNPNVIFELIGDDYFKDVILSDADIAIYPIDKKFDESKIEGVHYEYLFSTEKKLFASLEYIQRYGEPLTVSDLIKHHIISPSIPESHPFSNADWILTLGMPVGKLRKPIHSSNSHESLINAAKRGIGIVGSYDFYKIVKNSSLINILPDIKDKPIYEYFIYPSYLKDDSTIMDIKYYLKNRLNPTAQN